MSISLSTPFSQDMQNILSMGQAIPVVGPICVSPVKAIASVGQTIVAIAASILFGSLALLTNNKTLDHIYIRSQKNVNSGICHLAYSIINMLTLGIVGFKKEFAS